MGASKYRRSSDVQLPWLERRWQPERSLCWAELHQRSFSFSTIRQVRESDEGAFREEG